MTWRENRNKRIRFSIHFYADSDEFNQLTQINHLSLRGHPPTPLVSHNSPQPHPKIMKIPEPHPPPQQQH